MGFKISRKVRTEVRQFEFERSGAGSQPFVLWKDKQYAIHRMTYDHDVLQIEGDAESGRKLPATRERKQSSPAAKIRKKIGNETAPCATRI